MKIYLAIKYHPDQSNREKIEQLLQVIEGQGAQAVCIVRDAEHWGAVQYSPAELMELSFREIRSSQWLIVDLSEKGVGLGIEAGYACACGIPILTIAAPGSDISATLRGISQKVIFYARPDELQDEIRRMVTG